MFTGIVDRCGTIAERLPTADGLALRVECGYDDLGEGESIAVDGACLTARDVGQGFFWCDLSPETLERTTCRAWEPGARVNLERALRVGDRMGGHHVQGHVDETAAVATIATHGEFTEMEIAGVGQQGKRWLVSKGSVAVSGVSLTVNEVTPNGFRLMLIPHTLARTNLRLLKVGDRVNVEYDWMVKIIVDRLEAVRDREVTP